MGTTKGRTTYLWNSKTLKRSEAIRSGYSAEFLSSDQISSYVMPDWRYAVTVEGKQVLY